jgi:hypothetical protein
MNEKERAFRKSIMNQIPSVHNRNVSPNRSPNHRLNSNNRNDPFLTFYGKNMYFLDNLLRKTIGLLTGSQNKIYKGLHVVCNHTEKTCKYKITEEIEAFGDCFFHCALYNVGKQFFGLKNQDLTIRHVLIFRQLLVNHYIRDLTLYASPKVIESAKVWLTQYAFVDNNILRSYADMFERSVCVFTIGSPDGNIAISGGGFSVDLFINKAALDQIDFFILTQAPAHYTTLKRMATANKSEIMRRFLNYEVKVQYE